MRRLTKKSISSYVVDSELGLKLVEGSRETLAWLCWRLGVPADTDLPALFSDAIGVPQGLLTAVFLDRRSRDTGNSTACCAWMSMARPR